MLISVKHNIEIAHRLSQTPGKCENIHGHSMWVTLSLDGEVNAQGLLEGLEFGVVKAEFRKYLDEWYDHRLLLSSLDPLVMFNADAIEVARQYPGLSFVLNDNDPTTENIAKTIGDWALKIWGLDVTVEVQETPTNGATYRATPVGIDDKIYRTVYLRKDGEFDTRIIERERPNDTPSR